MYRPPPSPVHRPTPGTDETQLPKGECRYLLIHPELRGQRCGCVHFSLTASIPGSSCECGHGACYHIEGKEDFLSERQEIEALKEKVQQLEEMLHRERSKSMSTLIARLGELEEAVDKNKADIESEVKNAHRGISGLWHHVGIMQRRARVYDDKIEYIMDQTHGVQDEVRLLQKRVEHIDEAEMELEERLDNVTPVQAKAAAVLPHHDLSDKVKVEDSSSVLQEQPSKMDAISKPPKWTVHVSLLPSASQPFPFETDTSAYSRCLSRGLHRMIVIDGLDSKSFTSRISEVFLDLLRGRPWMPLVAKICDAENLQGLPMLKRLPSQQIQETLYDFDFLRKNCAVVDANGTIVDLYIALCDDVLLWSDLQQSPVFLHGLEQCWQYDSLLDEGRAPSDEIGSTCRELSEDAQCVGDMLGLSWSPRLKRAASNVSRTSSFGSVDGENKRMRICGTGSVEPVSRRAEAV